MLQPPTISVTLTLNQKEHLGVAPLIRSIHRQFPDKSSEEFRAATQSYMPAILRMWDFIIRQFMEQLLFREQHILGEIANLWEFPPSVRNVHHYHFLSRQAGILKEGRYAGTMENFLVIQTHDCAEGNNRCMVTFDAEGNRRFQFPPYDPKHLYG